MPTRSNKKYKKSRKGRKGRKGGANECERLPFSRLSYDELHSNYQKYCTNSNPLKNMLNSNCCKTLKNKFTNWTTEGRDFDDVIENYENDEQYNRINNITDEYQDGDIPESFIRTSMGGKTKKRRKLRK